MSLNIETTRRLQYFGVFVDFQHDRICLQDSAEKNGWDAPSHVPCHFQNGWHEFLPLSPWKLPPSPSPFSSANNHSSHRHFLKLDIPSFDGSNPHGWIFKISHFFDYHMFLCGFSGCTAIDRFTNGLNYYKL